MATGTVSAVIRAHQRRLVTFAISLVFAIAALPALAQQQESTQNVPPPPYYGYGHMMWGGPGPGWGWHPFMIVGPIFAMLAVIGIVVIFVWLVRWATHGFPFHHHGLHHFYGRGAALDILEERFARGEIDKAEFEDKRKTIGR
jgi:putative membrane protein